MTTNEELSKQAISQVYEGKPKRDKYSEEVFNSLDTLHEWLIKLDKQQFTVTDGKTGNREVSTIPSGSGNNDCRVIIERRFISQELRRLNHEMTKSVFKSRARLKKAIRAEIRKMQG